MITRGLCFCLQIMLMLIIAATTCLIKTDSKLIKFLPFAVKESKNIKLSKRNQCAQLLILYYYYLRTVT
jgi:hypothetical protein